MIASVLVDIKVHQVDQSYDYLIPEKDRQVIEKGMRVIVPFGRRDVMGYIVDIKQESTVQSLKPIKKILDILPALTPDLINLSKTLAKQNISPRVAMLQAMLPSALKTRSKKVLYVKDSSILSKDLQPFFKHNQAVFSEALTPYQSEIIRLLRSDQITLKQVFKETNQIQYDVYVKLEEVKAVRGHKQQAVIDYLSEKGVTKKADLISALKVSYATLKTLIDKEIIAYVKEEIYRNIETLYEPLDKDITLHEDQQRVLDTIISALNNNTTFLLHGITGSGKTEIYLNAIETVVSQGKEAILLLPEIALTPMMISRFRGRFKDNVAVLHSHLSIGEKYDEWRKVRRKEVQVVVGARSAIFAPFERLGIIIIDESHSETYKQNQSPAYHAIDVAKARAKTAQVPLVLGSATPSIESYYYALNNTYKLLELTQRANETTLPTVYVEDMTQEFKQGNRSIFSKRLHDLITDRLNKKQQVILLLNRRGHSTFVMCRSCGEVIMCPNCDISLTYHERTNTLKCHYCGHETHNVTQCPSCDSPHIRYMGIGTEKVEEMVKETFEQARVIRMDRDTTTKKNAHEKLLYEFEQQGDILIGTQMIAKGLDFPNVTLVGVLAADMSLNLPDYKAIEHTFQLLTQVSGRAGRHTLPGEVVIQTYNQDHYAIDCAKDQDYHRFYKEEIKIRQLAGYSPIKQIVQIIVSDVSVKKVLKQGTLIVLRLRKACQDVLVLGPVLPKVARIKNQYRAQIIIKYDQSQILHNVLQSIYDDMHKEIAIAIDYHPNLL
jgi:primosomal protein N' (replication factor Y)